MGVYKTLSLIIPLGIRKEFNNQLRFYGLKTNHDEFIGLVILLSLLFSVGGSFLLGFITHYHFGYFIIPLFILCPVVVYMWIGFVVDKRTNFIEEALPDALQLIASNLRSGMTADKSFILSGRPEFGPLRDEINIVGRKIAMGGNIVTALTDLSKRVPSKKLLRTIELINSGLSSGGTLAVLMESTANHLKEQMLVDKKIKASITMYVIFIFVAASMITPVLFGLSTIIVEILRSTLSQISIPTTGAGFLPTVATEINISNVFLMFYILIFILTNCFMASLILGLIGKGNKREGVKYFIPMAILAIILFLITQYVAKIFFQGFFNF